MASTLALRIVLLTIFLFLLHSSIDVEAAAPTKDECDRRISRQPQPRSRVCQCDPNYDLGEKWMNHIYYNPATQSCEENGREENWNRFTSRAECMDLCRGTSPAAR
uniref:Pancreatic trypsin inhibitor n=1 Tax=Rhipicephalus appendiculatus TaxID=34631 RepID=A0A131YHL2_RHIAP